MKTILMSVKHSTETLDAVVTYASTHRVGGAYGAGKTVIDIISIKSPISGWDLTSFDGVSAEERIKIKSFIADAEALESKVKDIARGNFSLDIQLNPYKSGSLEHRIFADELLVLQTEANHE